MRGETERDREIERETERETEVSGVSWREGNKDYEGIVKIGTTKSYQINNSY